MAGNRRLQAKNRYTGDLPGPKPMSPALFGSGSDAFNQPQVGQGGGKAPMGRGGHVALRGPNSSLTYLKPPRDGTHGSHAPNQQ